MGDMSPGRMWLANGVIAVLVLGHAYDVLRDREHWPFSPYTMYAEPRAGSAVRRFALYGLTETGEELAIRDRRAIRPLSWPQLYLGLGWVRGQRDGAARLDAALRACLRRYEALRVAGRHPGPPLRGLRLYWTDWTRDPQRLTRDWPVRRTLFAEVAAPPPGDR